LIQVGIRTVDSDGDNLREGEAVSALESGDLAQRLNLGVGIGLVEVGSRVGLGLNKLELEIVVLSSNEDRDSAGVVLFLRSATVEVGGKIALYLRYEQIQSNK
jgi:hypothetical protein